MTLNLITWGVILARDSYAAALDCDSYFQVLDCLGRGS